ncbi:MAG: hypothetical protein ISR78_00635 [Spirochaetia bacterium]|nr:hypothetical protein [Spirochaetia bacterium]
MKLGVLLLRKVDEQEKERDRKYRLAIRLSIAAIAAMTIFIVKDIVEGDILEMLYEAGICAVLLIGLVLLRKGFFNLLLYRFTLLIIALLFLYAVCIGSGKGTVLYWQFFIPLTFIYFLGEREGVFWTSVLAVILVFLVFNPMHLPIYSFDLLEGISFFSSYIFVSVIAAFIEHSRSEYAEKLETQIARSEKALHEIKVLQGLLPICSYCKKIRGDEGYWQDVAVYIQNNSHAEFTHSICPECEEKFLKEEASNEDTQ